MPYVEIAGSRLAPGVQPIRVYYRDVGPADGPPLLVLHGAWGYEFYPFDAQITALPAYRFVIPDRTGWGKSPQKIAALPARFHEAAAAEHEALLDALGIERCAIWGHSDGAVIAAIMALRRPRRVAGLIVEALHLEREKPRSRAFFATMADRPDGFGPRVAGKLAAEHGEAYWRTIVGAAGRGWMGIAATPEQDFYDHRLHELAVPMLVLHGAEDPRTEPGELDRVARELPAAKIHRIAGAGHSPHSEREACAEATAVAANFLRGLRIQTAE